MDILKYAAMTYLWFKQNLSERGYTCISTFYSDLTIAEVMGGKTSIEDTYKNIMREWMNDIVYITEFCMALNWKIWELEARKNNGETNVNLFPINDLQQCYNDLWQKCQSAIEKEYEDKPADLQYFYDVTD